MDLSWQYFSFNNKVLPIFAHFSLMVYFVCLITINCFMYIYSIYLYIYIYLYLYSFSDHLSSVVCLSVCQSVCLSVRLCTCFWFLYRRHFQCILPSRLELNICVNGECFNTRISQTDPCWYQSPDMWLQFKKLGWRGHTFFHHRAPVLH